jgi:hypothetical protein
MKKVIINKNTHTHIQIHTYIHTHTHTWISRHASPFLPYFAYHVMQFIIKSKNNIEISPCKKRNYFHRPAQLSQETIE